MSQFRETFTKEEKNNNVLDYDDSAFGYFSGCISLCILIPWTIVAAQKLWRSSAEAGFWRQRPKKSPAGAIIRYCQCSDCATAFQSQLTDAKKWTNRLSLSGTAYSLLLVCLWIYFFRLCRTIWETKPIQQFDPYAILQIDPSSPIREIKKAYRFMSLKLHPDKNTNDPTAAAKFILVTKAYETLTNPISKANYEKYGNPDGPGVMKIGIGLPKFLVDEEYQLGILMLFFTFLLIIIPMGFICYYQRQKKYAPNGVQIETLHFMSYYMTQSTRLKNFPEFLAASAESRELSLRESDDAEMKEIMEEVVEPKKRQFNMPIVVRNYFLILCHMQRLHHLLSPLLRRDLNKLLSASLMITQSMMEIATLRDWPLTAQSVVEFRRCLIQALDIRSCSLLQIPHFDDEILKHCHRGRNAVKELHKFIAQKQSERKGLNRMDSQQLADVQAFCSHVSVVHVTAEILVEDESEIVVGDIATCNVHLTRINLKEGEAVGGVHAPFFPDVKFEEWWFQLTDKKDGRILSFVRSKSLEREIFEIMQFEVTEPGRHVAVLAAMCDSYAGCDKIIEIEYKVFSDTEVKREVYIHPEDADLDNEPTLFQQMLGELAIEKSSDEEDESGFDDKSTSGKVGTTYPYNARGGTTSSDSLLGSTNNYEEITSISDDDD